ncbi:MAG: hypothetical protein QOE68_464, partial [Thermoanaerobaculia bacterium]|nr:hypothetical protein [Thermoanaerobaculia bacterium]
MSLRRRVALPVLVCLFALCFASPAAAQFSGTWTGTFVHRSPFASENACVRTGPITITLNSNGSASGSLSAVFDKTTFCQPASNTTQVATISPGSISNNILSGSLISTFFGNVQYQAVVSSNALFFTAPGANSEFHAMLFLPATSAAPPADLRGTWNGTVRENVVYCHSNILIDGTTEITFAQNANTFTAMLVVDMANDETNCQLTPSEGSQAGTFGGTIDGNTFVGTLMEDRNLGAISGVMSGSEINFTFSFPVDEPDLPNKSEILDSVWTAKVTRGTAAPAPSIPTFTATPSTIVAGDSATLSWTTQDATSASINQGINSVALSGSRSVSPTVTTTYTLTATGATAPAATKTATVTVTPCVQPNLVVTAFPIGMLQAVGGALPSDSFTLTNVGATSGTITLTKTGSFFTQTPSTFTIAAGASQVVSITAITQPAGFYPGSSIVSACGSATGLSIPINLRVAAPPTAPVTITASDARTEVASPGAGGTVTFTNPGTSTIQGLVITDVPWIIIPTPDLTLNAAETKQVAFTIDRSKRPDAAALTGGIAGSVYFRYVNIGSGTLSLPEPSAQTTAPGSPVISVVTVVVVDVVKTASIGDNAPPLNGQLALFIAGASSRTSFGDLTLSNRSTSAAIPDLRMYYGDVGGSPPLQSNSVGQFAANATFLFPSVLKNMFGQSDRTGTLQLRSAQMGNVSVSQTQVNANFGQT